MLVIIKVWEVITKAIIKKIIQMIIMKINWVLTIKDMKLKIKIIDKI
jgi:hypothetical protein